MRFFDRLDAIDRRCGLAGPPEDPPGWLFRWMARPRQAVVTWAAMSGLFGVVLLLMGVGIAKVLLYTGMLVVIDLPVGYLMAARTRDAVMTWNRQHPDSRELEDPHEPSPYARDDPRRGMSEPPSQPLGVGEGSRRR
jgi:hypothetical protein